MTLATFLYLVAGIFGCEAALLFFAACGDGQRASARFVTIGVGLVFVALSWSAVHFGGGIP